jgi:PAS domain S-box-containing protein
MGKNIKTQKELLLEIEALQAQLKKANDTLHIICSGKPAETKYRELVEQIPAITYIAALDEAGTTLYISPQIEAVLGFSPDEWLADPESWVKQLHPDDRERVLAEYKSSRERGRPFYTEYRWLTRDGRVLWCHDSAVLVNDDTGKPIFFQGIATDITELKQATEEIYLFQSVAMAISVCRNLHDALVVAMQKICNHTGWVYAEAWIPNQDGTCLERDHLFYSSIESLEKFSERSGGFTFTPGSGLPGRTWVEKQPVWIVDVTHDRHYLRAAIAGEAGLKTGIGFPVIADGEVVSIFVFYSLKAEERNDHLVKLILSMLSQIGSIIRRIQAEEVRKKLQEQLYRSHNLASIGKLAGGVAHNFNNLLTVIMGYASLLNKELGEKNKLKDYVQKILKSSETAAGLTQDLLAFSRKQPISAKPVNVNEIIKQSEALLSKLIREDITLKTILTREDTTVMADVGQIEQALMNLATNARDAMPNGGNLTIHTDIMEIDDAFIRSHAYGSAGIYVRISVTDTGVGMDENTRMRVFEPFFTTKEVGKGTGLGLASVYGIVKQHGGYINAESEPAKGATFNIYLPRIKLEAEKGRGGSHTVLSVGGTETVLLAEDEPEVRELIKMVFERAGYTVIAAVDGEDALNKFGENKDDIDLLVLDVIMPRKNGKEAYEAIRKVMPAMKVLFITGYGNDIISKMDIQKGKFDYLMKPVSPVELLRKVREVLERS